MRRALILLLLFAFSKNLAYSASTYFPPLQPIEKTDSIQDYSDNITSLPDRFANPTTQNYTGISSIENSLFGHSYDNQNINVRLSRIEKSLFSKTYPNSSEAQRIDNIISNFNQINKYPNISQSGLSRMESKVFSQTYQGNNPQKRIERLEQQIFGATQSGDINARYEALKIAMGTYRKNGQNINTQSMNDPFYQGNFRQRGLGLRGLGSLSGGYLTGYTPSIDPMMGQNYAQNYTQSYGQNCGNFYGNKNNRNSGYRQIGSSQLDNSSVQDFGPYGMRMQQGFSDFGTGCGVHILD